MDERSYKKILEDINRAISEARINDALTYIKEVFATTGEMQLSSEYDSIQTDYRLMLSFMENGGNDPQRHLIHKRIILRTFQLLDKIDRARETTRYASILACVSSEFNNNPAAKSLDTLQSSIETQIEDFNRIHLQADFSDRQKQIQEKEILLYQSYASAFDFIWVQDVCTAEEALNLQNFIESIEEDKQQAHLLSALFLNTWRFFDAQKFLTLIHFSHSDKDAVRIRAITSVVLLYIKYYSRMEYYEVIQEKVKALEDDKRVVHELKILQKQLFLSLEAKKVERKIREKIFPEIMKNKIYQRSKMGFEDMENELEEALREEAKRTWKKKEGTELAQEMQEIMKMQVQGVDVNLSTFSTLKSFPFFQQSFSTWFVPFDINTPEVYNLFHNEDGTIRTNMLPISASPHYCDSDKYSLSIMLQRLPAGQRDFIVNEILAKLSEEHIDEDVVMQMQLENKKIEVQYRLYLQNLYRFFYLNVNCKQFLNPFNKDLCLTHYSGFDYLLDSMEYNEQLIDFLIQFEHFEGAIEYIEHSIKKDNITAGRLQKMGHCYQKINNMVQALDCYQKADLLNPDNEWVLTNLHICYSSLGRYQEALNCLLKLEQINPESTKIVSETGFCLLQLERYEEAANRFYKLEYNGERIWASARAIAWCNFKMKKIDQAIKYYNKIIENDKAKWEDYLNYGHALWCKGDIRQAVGSYKKYKELYAKTLKENQDVLTPFIEDYKELHAHGISKHNLALMHDIIEGL